MKTLIPLLKFQSLSPTRSARAARLFSSETEAVPQTPRTLPRNSSTGSGKTWIALTATEKLLVNQGRSWYASPLKALSNSKYTEFSKQFGGDNVGILTGDRKENPQAPIIVGTTEILRNQLYDAMHRGENLGVDLVVLDEAHYLGDEDRGVVWEEVMIYLPAQIRLLLLSATISNASQIAGWLESLRQIPCRIITAHERPVPLYPLFMFPNGEEFDIGLTSNEFYKIMRKSKKRFKLNPELGRFKTFLQRLFD